MLRKNFLLLLLLAVISASFAQDKPKKIARPNIPGSFMIDLGLNRGIGKPTTFKQGFWGSRTLNLYYQYPIRFGKSKFSFNPGIGLSLERWKFTSGATLIDTVELTTGGQVAAEQVKEFNLLSPRRTIGELARKSMLVANYLEIPIEFRFDTNPEDISRSFNIAIGGRVGVLYDTFTKIKYRKDGETNTLKDKSNHGLNPIRYGLYTRVGIGGFNWFAFYNLSEMFKTNQGPLQTTMNSITVGISINGF